MFFDRGEESVFAAAVLLRLLSKVEQWIRLLPPASHRHTSASLIVVEQKAPNDPSFGGTA